MMSLRYKTQHQAYQLVWRQLLGVVFLSLVVLILTGFSNAYSVFLGGAAYGVSNLIFVWRVFRFSGASEMAQFVSAFFIFEMIKLILSAILFVLIVKYLPVSLLFVLVGFAGAIVSFWVVSMRQFAKAGIRKTSKIA